MASDTEATVEIDLSISSDHVVQPEIYGGFIEFISSTINRKNRLWSKEIDYRGFEAADTVGYGAAGRWSILNQGNNVCTSAGETVGSDIYFIHMLADYQLIETKKPILLK
ncbi:hypothetical protein JW824_09625 [bacterium]|nr:hypothetical protein [bacterium]RQV94349.1 MAG: hypothetical protein EH221_07825 [bacterium]